MKKIAESIANEVMYIIKEKLNDRYSIPFEYDDALPNNKEIKIGYHRSGDEILEMIDESLVQSYPPQNVINIVKSKFNLNDEDVYKLDTINNIGPSYVIVMLLPETMDKQTIGNIKQFMNWSGYFIQNKKIKRVGNKLSYCFEPKFGYNIAGYVKKNFRYLYHMTPKKHLDRILKYGLQPRTQSKLFEYPDRVYLMAGNTLDKLQVQILWFVAKSTVQDFENPKDDNTFVLLTIDTEKIPNNVLFYGDSTSHGAIFTHDNIPPSAIVNAEPFEINNLKE